MLHSGKSGTMFPGPSSPNSGQLQNDGIADDRAVDDAVAHPHPVEDLAPPALGPAERRRRRATSHGARRLGAARPAAADPRPRPRIRSRASAISSTRSITRAKTSPSVRVRPLNDSSPVCRVRVGAPGVAIDARRARGHALRAVRPRRLARQHAGRLQPVAQRVRVERQADERRRLAPRLVHGRPSRPPVASSVSGAATPPGTTRPRKNRLPNEPGRQPPQPLDDAEAVGGHHRVAGAHPADVGEIVQVHREPLELHREHAERARPLGDLAAGQRSRPPGRTPARARRPSRPTPVRRAASPRSIGPALEQLLDALVGEEQLPLERDDPLAGHVEPEVARLDDAGVDRPDRDLEDALALHPSHRVRLVRRARAGCPSGSPCAADACRPGRSRGARGAGRPGGPSARMPNMSCA